MTTDERLDRLERQNRRLRSGLVSLVVVMLVGGLLGFATQDTVPDVLKAKELHAVDGDGNVLVRIGGKSANGFTWGYVETLNPEAQKLVSIGSNVATGVGAIKTYSKGQQLVNINGTNAGGTDLGQAGMIQTFIEEKPSPIVMIATSLDGGGNLSVFSPFEKVNGRRVPGGSASINVLGRAGQIRVWNHKKESVVWIGANQSGEGYISTWGTVSPTEVQPFVILSSRDGAGVVGVRAPSDEGQSSAQLVPMTGGINKPWKTFYSPWTKSE